METLNKFEYGDVVSHLALGEGKILKSLDGGEVHVRFEDGDYIKPETELELLEKAEPQKNKKRTSQRQSTRSTERGDSQSAELTEVQEVFLSLKTATVEEVIELCESDRSPETVQREIRKLREFGYDVSSAKNENGHTVYSLLEQDPGHNVDPASRRKVLDVWRSHPNQWLHDRDITKMLGLSVNKECAVAAHRRALMTEGYRFETRVLENKKHEFRYIGEKLNDE